MSPRVLPGVGDHRGDVLDAVVEMLDLLQAHGVHRVDDALDGVLSPGLVRDNHKELLPVDDPGEGQVVEEVLEVRVDDDGDREGIEHVVEVLVGEGVALEGQEERRVGHDLTDLERGHGLGDRCGSGGLGLVAGLQDHVVAVDIVVSHGSSDVEEEPVAVALLPSLAPRAGGLDAVAARCLGVRLDVNEGHVVLALEGRDVGDRLVLREGPGVDEALVGGHANLDAGVLGPPVAAAAALHGAVHHGPRESSSRRPHPPRVGDDQVVRAVGALEPLAVVQKPGQVVQVAVVVSADPVVAAPVGLRHQGRHHEELGLLWRDAVAVL